MSQRQIIQGETPELFSFIKKRRFSQKSSSLCLFVFAVFEQYQKSRMQFVQTVADLASRPQNIEILQNAGKKEDRETV